jgi:hypothetical protein
MSSTFTHPNLVKSQIKKSTMKAILLFFISVFSISFSNESLPGSNRSWIAVENANGSDDQYSDFSNLNNSANSYTDYILINKFLLDVPMDAIITGIEINVERSDPNQHTADYSVKILKYGVVTGDEKSTGAAYPASDGYNTYGGAGDLWGEFWTPDMINDNGFGIAIAAQRISGHNGQTNGRVDDVTITVFFDQPSTLPVSLINFSAKKNNSSINLTWTTDDEANMSHYELQRSADGRNYSTILSVQSKNSVSRTSYTAIDNKPVNGIGYYRIKMMETDGSATYSRIVTVQSITGNTITVYPTMWKKGSTLNISNPNNEKLDAYFFNPAGQHIGESTTINSTLPTTALNNQKGIIYFKIANANGLLIGKGRLLID